MNHWIEKLDERQQRLVANCRDYAAKDPAGVPGHNLMLIIDQMARLLDEAEGVDTRSRFGSGPVVKIESTPGKNPDGR